MTFSILTIISLFGLVTSVLSTPLNLSIHHVIAPITTYTALGDSYASGVGAGHPAPSLCGHFSAAYPVQLAHSLSPVRFHSVACGGASIASVMREQFGWIEDSDLVTLTVGGNEVNFLGVLNECVYRWWPVGSCERELRRSRALIENAAFVEGYFRMVQLGLQMVRWGEKAGKREGKGRFLVTGYATFFNEETGLCDDATFSCRQPRQPLTRSFRRELNQLVRMLNHVIRSATEAAGAEYVDIDQAFEGHRFCEAGVREPDVFRSDTWFFNLHSQQAAGFETRLRQDEGQQERVTTGQEMGLGDVTRVFHPTSQGHSGIRDTIINHFSR